MARAKRHYIPEQIWHITHRCHKREFLLKFAKDRQRWLQWLFQARKRYGLTILNYSVTSNHIHMLVMDDNLRDVIPKSMQLVAGRSGQEYNQRKKRKGASWEDRYHATAIETDQHFLNRLMGSAPGDGRLSPMVTPLVSVAGRGLSTAGGGILKAKSSVNNAIDNSYDNYYAPAVDWGYDQVWDFVKPHPTPENIANFANGSFPASTGSSSNGGGGNGC